MAQQGQQGRQTSIFWMRRDLRAHDNVALHAALSASSKVVCVFIYDRTILDDLPRDDKRVAFIHACIEEAAAGFAKLGGGLLVREGDPATLIPALAAEHDAARVYANQDYEPYATKRDGAIADALQRDGRELVLSKDHVLLHKDDVLSLSNTPYARFTPYYNAWQRRLQADPDALSDHDPAPFKDRLAKPHGAGNIALKTLGFEPIDLERTGLPPGTTGGRRMLMDFIGQIDRYIEDRNKLALAATSGLSLQLRFGTVSIREVFREVARRVDTNDASVAGWIREVCWREYFSQLLYHVPRVAEGPYQPKYARLDWVRGEEGKRRLDAWKNAKTGYPIVDAAMTQLNTTGAMHNRARLIAGSFLVKNLGIDWREGEAYFALKLNDYEQASNNGNWQWVASTGADAQPPYRIFNPAAQAASYDPDAAYIKHWLPQLKDVEPRFLFEPWKRKDGLRDHPAPIVDYEASVEEFRARYDAVK